MLYRHNAAIGRDWNLVFWDNSLFAFFLFLKYPEMDFDNFFFFFPIFGLKQPDFRKKNVFWLVVRGVYPPYTLSGPTTKKKHFLCVSSLRHQLWSEECILTCMKHSLQVIAVKVVKTNTLYIYIYTIHMYIHLLTR